MISFQIYNDLDASEVEEIIRNLYYKKNNIFFQSNSFINNCKNIYHNNKSKIYIIVLKENNEPILVAPLYIQKKFTIKILKWLSCETIDFNIPICDFKYLHEKSEEINKVFLKALNSLSFDILMFDKFPEFVLETENLFLKNFLKKYSISCYFDGKEETETFYINKTNSKIRQTDRRKLKKITNNEKIYYEKTNITKENFEIFEKLVKDKFTQYFYKNTKTFNTDKVKMFYFNVVNDKEKNFKLIIHKMKVKNTVISIIFGIEQFNSFYYLIPYIPVSPVYKFSPGRFHIKELLDFYKKKKMNFDFTAGDEKYKKQWSNQFYDMNYLLKIKNIKGFPIFVYYWLYYYLRNFKIIKKILQFLKVL